MKWSPTGSRRAPARCSAKSSSSEGYGMTEIWPLGGRRCRAGHVHFESAQGLIEVVDPDTGGPAGARGSGRHARGDAIPTVPPDHAPASLRHRGPRPPSSSVVRLRAAPTACHRSAARQTPPGGSARSAAGRPRATCWRPWRRSTRCHFQRAAASGRSRAEWLSRS